MEQQQPNGLGNGNVDRYRLGEAEKEIDDFLAWREKMVERIARLEVMTLVVVPLLTTGLWTLVGKVTGAH
jgi:hypothetical protein